MAAHQSTIVPAAALRYPPDPYARDPLSWTRVIFRPIPDFPGYGVDTLGFVWRCLYRKMLGPCRGCVIVIGDRWWVKVPCIDKSGYKFVNLYRDGKGHPRRVHLLVLSAFIGPRPPGMVCCHGRGGKRDNGIGNLRWGTEASNYADRDAHGTTARGERNGRSKLVAADIPEMFRLRSLGWSYLKLARWFAISKRQAMRIIKGEQWLGIEAPRAVPIARPEVDPARHARKAGAEEAR